jgi:hypothetical protein
MNKFADNSISERSNITNNRLNERIISSQYLQPYLDARPVSTKYATLPIVDLRKPISTPMTQTATYNQHAIFNPGDSAPWSGYASQINTESQLKNQIFALQKNSQAVYIPSSKSDLYQFKLESTHEKQPFPDLFNAEPFNTFNPNPANNGYGAFSNHTRQQRNEN